MNEWTTVNVYDAGEHIGWLWQGGCEHSACRAAVAEGRPVHACPPTGKGTLAEYHYATADEGITALETHAQEKRTGYEDQVREAWGLSSEEARFEKQLTDLECAALNRSERVRQVRGHGINE
jgi:hypothetical protein